MVEVWYKAAAHGRSWGQTFMTPYYSSYSREEKTSMIINRLCAENAFAGAVLGGINQASLGTALPLTFAASLSTSLFLQFSLSAGQS